MKTTVYFRVFALVAILTSISAGAQTFQVLHAFAPPPTDASPGGPIMLNPQGDIFFDSGIGGGTTDCGTSGCGAVFELSKGYGRWRETTLFSFGAVNGSSVYPSGALSMDLSGNIYGTQGDGGDPLCNCGAVYQLTHYAAGWSETLLHNFLGGTSDGMHPYGLVRDSAGNFYGSTVGGGINNNGTIFEMTPNSDGTWNYSVIHYFAYGSNNFDGSIPAGPLTIDALGDIHGTTISGGLWGYGIAFRLSPSNGAWTETVLFNFPLDYGSTPQPWGVVQDAAGNLYGATITGGAYALGTIYKLTPALGFWNRTILHTFTGNDDGANPFGGFAIDATGALYGASELGGSFGYGNIYKFARVQGQWKQTPLHQFTSGTDGGRPINGVVLDWRGNIYGSTDLGGTHGYGTAFEITP
jgi:uncharacterized repeat protein (TIGR03803 family)